MNLIADRLQKKFGAITAVADVSFAAEPGKILGLLGPNGAGKSTTISMLAGLTTPDSGRVQIDGATLRTGADPTKRRLGLVTQEIALLEQLPARMNLEFFGGLYGLSGPALGARIAAVLELTSLSDRARDPPSTFSGGMRRRLNIACALLHEPQILLLDEPTVGVDPQSRNAIFETIEVLAGQGRTVVYTTHYMEEVERLLASAPVGNKLTLKYDGAPDCAALAEIRSLPGVVQVDLAGTEVSVSANDLGTAAPRVLERLAARGFSCQELTSRRANLEDVFLALTGRTLRDT
jgi:ABC-2 type transport system ATP-binding protein